MENYDGYIKLVRDLLIITYHDLIESYIWMDKNKEKCKPLLEKVNQIWNYAYYYKSFLKIKRNKKFNKKQQEIVDTYKSLKKPKQLSKKEQSMVDQYNEHEHNILTSESFYRSPRFAMFTLGEYENGEAVILKARKEAGRSK